ncbi:sugar phosphate isomerase/epimerase [uncultured Sunxiuqinia sp.]|uniref:sugar phosphate isomerase/epimerase family protein n=1 Tax=uncultured Sunxiuqinia sp. TaxID=1573825 RepID=UPI0026022916|nr:sugar phosphate isomerase/epimerase [uncultured Sunxiuqinia sp.]
MKSRREFLQISAAGSVGIALLGSFSACTTAPADRKSYGVGIQLYTIRDAMSADAPGSLKKVSDLGYKNLELAGYSNGKFYGYTPAEFKKMVNDLGMEIISSHTQVEAAGITLENANLMADAHAKLGVKYCIQPWVNDEDRQVETYKKMIAEWNKVGAIMKERGIQFGYHNHNFEFDTLDGLVPYYDLFMPELDADLVTMELDLFWASKAEQDPVEMFNKYPGRFQLLHMKDMRTNEDPFYNVYKEDVCSVGEGVIDFKRILATKETAGTKYLFVEDDNQGNGKPFEGIETSIVNLTTKFLS